MKKFYPRKYKKRVYKKKTYAKRKPKVTKSIRTYVKRCLDKRIENKEVVQQSNSLGFFQIGVNSIISSFVGDLTPTINQSVGENGRIGNDVMLKKAMLRGTLVLNANAAGGITPVANAQFFVRIFIGRMKQTTLPPTTPQLNQLLRAGATVYPFDSGDGLSLCRTVNSELFTIYYDKIHKIGSAHNGGTSVSGLGNNDFSLSKFITINCTKMYKKKLIFQDTSINQPTNTSLFIFGAVVDSLFSTNIQAAPLVRMAYDMEFSYEDA